MELVGQIIIICPSPMINWGATHCRLVYTEREIAVILLELLLQPVNSFDTEVHQLGLSS